MLVARAAISRDERRKDVAARTINRGRRVTRVAVFAPSCFFPRPGISKVRLVATPTE